MDTIKTSIDDIILLNQESLVYLKNLNDKSIDAIITDPPYGIDLLNANKWDIEKIDKRKKNIKSMVKSIPAGMKFSTKDGIENANRLKPIFSEGFRILKPGGFCIVFAQSRGSHRIGTMLEDCGFEIRDIAIWDYGAGQGKAQSMNNHIRKNKLLSHAEKEHLILQCQDYKTAQLSPTYEPIVIAQKPKEGKCWETFIKYGTGLINCSLKTPSNRFSFSKPKKSERNSHPTQKPIALMTKLIEVFTKPKARILDPFLGSGTTAISAIYSDRKCIGIEKEKKYYDIAVNRLEQIKQETINRKIKK